MAKLFWKNWDHHLTDLGAKTYPQPGNNSMSSWGQRLADEYQRLPPSCLHFLHTKLFAEIKHLHSTKSKFIPVFRIMSHAVEKAIILFHRDKTTELFRQDCIITWISRVSLHLKSVLFLLQLPREIDITRSSTRIENSFSQVCWPQCQKEKYVLKRWDWYCSVSGKDGIYRPLTLGKASTKVYFLKTEWHIFSP